MAEVIHAITRPAGKTSARFVGDTRFTLKPGETLNLARSLVDDRLVAEAAAGEFIAIPELGTEPTELSEKNARQFRLLESQIQFMPDGYAAALGTPGTEEIVVQVTDDDGNRSLLASEDQSPDYPPVVEAQVDITGGTAANKKLRHGANVSPVDGSLIVPIVDGEVKVTVEGDGAGTVLLGLTDSGGYGLDVSDAATVTFS